MNANAANKVELTAQRLLEAYRYLGAAHAQKTFAALTEGAKDWEAKAIRARFQELAREHDQSKGETFCEGLLAATQTETPAAESTDAR